MERVVRRELGDARIGSTIEEVGAILRARGNLAGVVEEDIAYVYGKDPVSCLRARVRRPHGFVPIGVQRDQATAVRGDRQRPHLRLRHARNVPPRRQLEQMDDVVFAGDGECAGVGGERHQAGYRAQADACSWLTIRRAPGADHVVVAGGDDLTVVGAEQRSLDRAGMRERHLIERPASVAQGRADLDQLHVLLTGGAAADVADGVGEHDSRARPGERGEVDEPVRSPLGEGLRERTAPDLQGRGPESRSESDHGLAGRIEGERPRRHGGGEMGLHLPGREVPYGDRRGATILASFDRDGEARRFGREGCCDEVGVQLKARRERLICQLPHSGLVRLVDGEQVGGVRAPVDRHRRRLGELRNAPASERFAHVDVATRGRDGEQEPVAADLLRIRGADVPALDDRTRQQRERAS